MKDRDRNRHPGPFRVMRADAEFAGILIAVSFVVLGLVGSLSQNGFCWGPVQLVLSLL